VSVPPTWLTVLAWISLAAGFSSAAAVLYDIYGRGLRQPMRVMEAVWPITALYLGLLGWFVYAWLGRPRLKRVGDEREWEGYAISGSHCGAGCALGDVIGEWAAFAGSLTIAGAALWSGYALDFAFGYVLGILFQYWAIKPMSHLSRRATLRDAIRADTLSVVAFEAGMFAFMALVYFAFFTHPHLGTDNAAYWLMMQIAMAIGLATTYPVQIWLIRRGIKHTMGRPTHAAAA
jgi:Domain of unknown function (DUF4396)